VLTEAVPAALPPSLHLAQLADKVGTAAATEVGKKMELATSQAQLSQTVTGEA